VYIEGRLQTRKWQGQEGQDRYSTEIVANEMQMLDSRGGGTTDFGENKAPDALGGSGPVPQSGGSPGQPVSGSADAMDDFDDDIPF